METANRYHAAQPSAYTEADRAKARATYHKPAPAYSLADALKHGGMILSALVVLGAIL